VAVLEIARWQCLLGQSCTILTGEHNGPRHPQDVTDSLYQAGVSIIQFPSRGPQKFRYLMKFQEYLEDKGRDFDLYVLHGSYQYPAYAAAHFCQSAKIPYIFTPHGSLDPAVRKKHWARNRLIDLFYHDRVIRKASAWHFTSEEERAACERPIWRRSFVEPLGIDIDKIPKDRPIGGFRKKHGIPDDGILLLFLSRITKKKGIDILLKAFRDLIVGSANVYLALCGPIDQDMKALLEEALNDDIFGSRIVVTGLLMGDDKDAAFFDCNYFVLPTLSENFGIAAFEALAYGAPLITTTGMNLHAKLSENGRTMVVEPTAAALHLGLLEMITEKWKPATTKEDVRVWLNQNFSWRIRANNLTKRYLEAMRNTRQR
jgi:glycosyltransferase involved in cell wall biosynthesis